LLAAAKHYGVNTGKIERGVKAEAAAKAKAAKIKAQARAKATAKKAAKPKTAAKLFPVPTCTHCACTEAAACPDGCSWVKLDKATNAGVCSRCAPAKGKGGGKKTEKPKSQKTSKAGKPKARETGTPAQRAARQVVQTSTDKG